MTIEIQQELDVPQLVRQAPVVCGRNIDLETFKRIIA